ncbi:hypothetical protein TSACC_21692 [Terrimicrobium sacchariphilum]|uniref:Uncharacterized protein n=1 Tax=Terrimicrobium sacchariphilum TaxID=690879 RepID=A0A146G691_TERSA|nr:hypothetical protein [Terrimicrobium sacchariphilum]GAT33279.1 hypothetical protein TSACC_21692 [Terrimicrobium sacchariphilum]
MTITIDYETEEELPGKLATVLERFGWIVLPPNPPYVTPGEYRKRFGVSSGALSTALADPCVPSFASITGPSGRINKLLPNTALDRWLAARFGKRKSL